MKKMFYDAEEVAQLIGISKSRAYSMMAELNAISKKEGWLVISVKTNKDLLLDNIYVSHEHEKVLEKDNIYARGN